MQLSARSPAAAAASGADLFGSSRRRPAVVTAAAVARRPVVVVAAPAPSSQQLQQPKTRLCASSFQGPSFQSPAPQPDGGDASGPSDRDVATSALSALAADVAAIPAAAVASTPTTTPKPRGRGSGLLAQRAALRRAQRQAEQIGYQMSAVAASVGVTSVAVVATYYKFSREVSLLAFRAAETAQQAALDAGASADAAARAAAAAAAAAPFPWVDMAGTLALVVGGVVGMEMWARWAHKALWHDAPAGWALHKSHHEPRVGPFEANDLFAVVNAAPAFGLCLYGFLTPGMPGSLSFGAGLGITLFGIMYMFVHDGLVHRRFPVGPIASLPYMKRLVVAHRLHHSEKYGGVPWGLFLGPQELEAIGAGAELDALVSALDLTEVSGGGAAAGGGGEAAGGAAAAAAAAAAKR
jgi:beta-carotene 3-hydroxylase